MLFSKSKELNLIYLNDKATHFLAAPADGGQKFHQVGQKVPNLRKKALKSTFLKNGEIKKKILAKIVFWGWGVLE